MATTGDMEAALEGPGMTPPPGITPDFEHPGGNHTAGYVVIVVCAVFSTLAVLLRLYTRATLKKMAIPDALFIVALGFFAGHCYVTYELAIYPGLYVHQWNVQMRFLSPLLYNISIGYICYAFVSMFLKIGILLDWLAIFVPAGTRNMMFWISWALIWINGLFYTIVCIIEIFQCTPREKIWNLLYQGGYCIQNSPVRNLIVGCLTALSDIAMLALPQSIIWNLNTTFQKKMGLSLLFAVGVFACSCAIARQVYFARMLYSVDILYHATSAAGFTMWEMTAGFLIVGIPCVPKAAKGMSELIGFLSTFLSFGSRKGSSENAPYPPRSWQRRSDGERHQRPWQSFDEDEDALVAAQGRKSEMKQENRGVAPYIVQGEGSATTFGDNV